MKHFLYRKMLNMQAGSCPSDLSEGTILGLLGQTGHGHGIVQGWPNFFGCFLVQNFAIGFYLYSKFGTVFAFLCLLVVAAIFGISALSKLLKPMREEREEVEKESRSVLSEVFNNIKMIKLYGWQQLFHKRLVDTRK
jgi:Na+-transporting methylmalonyl-CoA/oxaloacetate decarboxylase gamma subunit